MKKSLARGAIYNVICSAGNVLFPLISAGYLARVLLPEGVGQVSCGQNIVSYFTMFAAMGIPQYGIREIARAEEEKDRLFSELVIINGISTAAATAAYVGFLLVAFPEQQIYRVLVLELVFQLFNIDWLYQGKEAYGFITVRSLAVRLLTLAGIFLFVRDRQDTAVYALILCLCTILNHVINVLHAGSYVKLTLRGLNLRRHLTPILALMLSAVTASLYCKVDVTMLGLLAGDAQVGFYTSAYKVVNIVLSLAAAVTAVFLPRLSQAYGQDRQRYCDYLSAGLKAVLLLALPCWVGLMLTAEDLTAVLFGGSFAPAAAGIRILSVLILIRGTGDLLCYQAIISSGKERKLIFVRVLAGAANIVLNAVLIPKWGYCGAAAASVVSELVVNGVLLTVSLTIAKPKVGGRFTVSVICGTLVMIPAVLLAQTWTESAPVSLALSVPAGAVTYFAAVLLINKGGRFHEWIRRRI